MLLDKIDIRILNENFEYSVLNKLDKDNVNKIYNYLIDKGIYFAKDIFISNADLFLMDFDLFAEKFDKLVNSLGNEYITKIEENYLLIESIY